MEYRFTYTLTEDECAEFSAYTAWLTPDKKSYRINFITRQAIYFVLGICGFFFIHQNIGQNELDLPLVYKIIGIGTPVLIVWIIFNTPNRLRAKTKLMLRQEDFRHLLSETDLTVNQDQIINIDKVSTLTCKWQGIVKYAVTKDAFYLYTDPLRAMVIPKRLFNSQAELSEFEKFLLERTPFNSLISDLKRKMKK
jgi:hypothetical protein